ncbi:MULTISPECIES: amino acid adenylation domain-containing protein [unclassified Micromonospora]|uniref:non-ribosomal peptide synthetase n=1 Tax=unclassified Micromonospora TaxID=2617518 RepID=UPI003329F983
MTDPATPVTVPLLPVQEGLWFVELVHGRPGSHNVGLALALHGELDEDALEHVLTELSERHAAMRVQLAEEGGKPYQIVLPTVPVPVRRVAVDPTKDLAAAFDAEQAVPFDVTGERLLRATLFAVGPRRHALLVVMHHSVTDGASMDVLAEDFCTLYDAVVTGAALPEPAPGSDYLSYVRRDGDRHQSRRAERARAYWMAELHDAPRLLPLPGAERSGVHGNRLVTLSRELPAPLVAAVNGCAAEVSATPFMVISAAAVTVLSRYGGGADMVLGVPLLNRNAPGRERLVALTADTLPIRLRFDRTTTSFTDLVNLVRGRVLNAMRHQDLPFHQVVRLLGGPPQGDAHPVFQVALNHGRRRTAPVGAGGLRVERLAVANTTPALDLIVNITEHDTGITVYVEYDPDVLALDDVRRMADSLVLVLGEGVRRPDLPVVDLPLITPEERRRLVALAAGPALTVPAASLPDLFAAQVARQPAAPAVRLGERVVSYGELNAAAEGVANSLRTAGLRSGEPVALLLDRSVEAVVAILGTLKAGGAYLPLDTRHPAPRLRHILTDSGARLLLTDRQVDALGLPGEVRVLSPTAAAPAGGPLPSVDPAGPAYIMYTSGSTGMPKGVVISHRSVAAFAADPAFAGPAHRRVLLHASLAFDASTYELWIPLLSGGEVVVAPAGGADLDLLLETIQVHGVTAALFTTALFNLLSEHVARIPSTLREIWTGGEAAAPESVRRVVTGCPWLTVVNAYGPTEVTTAATVHHVRGPSGCDGGPVPIGVPLSGTQVHVLDERREPVPVGVVGEVHVAGEGLALGYLNRPDLTAERFVDDPFGPAGSRMYRTGDLARRDGDGVLTFAGRVDDQVKIRGFRIEPREVESLLTAHPAVARAAVQARPVRPDRPDERQLVAYVVPAPEAPVRTDADLTQVLRNDLGRQVPDYLVPGAVVQIPELPLTANGKLDVRALPDPDVAVPVGPRQGRDPQEELLRAVFGEVLGCQVGVDDDFFALGGHSLLAVRLVERIRVDVRGAALTVRDLFESRTPANLSARLRGGTGSVDAMSPLFVLRPAGDDVPLFCVHPAAGLGWPFARLLPVVPPGRPVYALQAVGLTSPGHLPATLANMAADYVERIRAVRPEGPYHLLGWSFGGLLAHAVAVQLQEAGQAVGMLAVLDSYPQVQGDEDIDDLATVHRRLLAELGAPQEVTAGFGGDRTELRRLLLSGAATLTRTLPPERVDALIDVFVHNSGLALQPPVGTFRGDLHIVAAEESLAAGCSPKLWQPYVDGAVLVRQSAGRHEDLLSPESVASVGALFWPATRDGAEVGDRR